MGAEVVPVSTGTRTLKDATTEAIRDWVTTVRHSHYIIGSVVGPAPYPRMVRDFQAVIGREARAQMLERTGGLPTTRRRLRRGRLERHRASSTRSWTTRAWSWSASRRPGKGSTHGRHSASLVAGDARRAARHAELSAAGCDTARCIPRTRSRRGSTTRASDRSTRFSRIPGARPTSSVTDAAGARGFGSLSRLEGMIPALETAHAVAWIEIASRPLVAG